MQYSDFIQYFNIQKRRANSCQVICPCHNDHEASLTITDGKSGIAMHCHAGCKNEDILQAVGLQMRDLYEHENNTIPAWKVFLEMGGQRKIERMYHYFSFSRDSYCFSKIRFQGKKFLIGRFEGEIENSRFDAKITARDPLQKQYPDAVYGNIKKVRQTIQDDDFIYVCEGEKDVDTLSKLGYPALTYGSADSWHSELATIFSGAWLVVLSDNDRAGFTVAEKIKTDTAGICKGCYIITPSNMEHGDVTDYFEAGHTKEDFESLILENTVNKEETADAAGESTIEYSEDQEIDLDQFHLKNEKGGITGVFDYAIVQFVKQHYDLFILGGVPYIYSGGVYRQDASGAELKTIIRGFIYPTYIKSTTIKRVYDLFICDSSLQRSAEDLNNYPREWINFENGFYDAKNRQMIPHSPEYLSVNQIPHTFKPATYPKKQGIISEWLKSICENDTDIKMLLQYIGYSLTIDCRQQKLLILCGEGGTGKSTLIKLINTAVGCRNISNISLNQLTQRFSAYGLMGKLVNSCADLEIDALSDVSTLKKILGEDSISAEAKGKDAISFTSYAKLIFSTNELPIVRNEKTNGFYRRLLILNMNRVPERRDPNIFDKLSAEIDDFIRLGVSALEQMYQNGTIAASENSIEAVKRLRCDSDTVEAFLNDCVLREPSGKTKKLTLYNSYETYCQDVERQSLTKNNFYRTMKLKGFSEIKTGGTFYFKGVTLGNFDSKTSLKTSLLEIGETLQEENPFDT